MGIINLTDDLIDVGHYRHALRIMHTKLEEVMLHIKSLDNQITLLEKEIDILLNKHRQEIIDGTKRK